MDRISFDDWFEEIKDYAVKDFGFTREAADSMDKEAYRDYYKDEYTSLEALKEDMSRADL
jgi:hypothetical protein